MRILQLKELKDKYSATVIRKYIAGFNCVKTTDGFLNTTSFDEEKLEFITHFKGIINKVFFQEADFKNLFKIKKTAKLNKGPKIHTA